MQTLNKINVTIQQGWECPKCGRVYSPSQNMCLYCPLKVVSGSTTSTNTYITGTSRVHNFEPDVTTSSSIKCKICGLEKWQHPIISTT